MAGEFQNHIMLNNAAPLKRPLAGQTMPIFTVAIEKDTSILSAIEVQAKKLHTIKTNHCILIEIQEEFCDLTGC